MTRTGLAVIIALCILVLLIAGLFAFHILDRQFHGSSETVGDPFAADNNNDQVCPFDPHDTVIVGLYNSGYLYNEEQDSGISKDIVTELFKRVDLKYELRVLPRARIVSMIEEGTLQVIVSSIRTPEREKYAWFVPYFAERNMTIVRGNADITSEAELLESKDVKVGIVRGYYYGEYYMNLIEKLRGKRMIVETKDIDELFSLLRDDWIQVTFNNPSSYLYYLKEKGIEDVKIYDFDTTGEPLVRGLMLSKKCFSEEYVRIFEEAIAEMNEDGTLYAIFSRYLPEDLSKKACDY